MKYAKQIQKNSVTPNTMAIIMAPPITADRHRRAFFTVLFTGASVDAAGWMYCKDGHRGISLVNPGRSHFWKGCNRFFLAAGVFCPISPCWDKARANSTMGTSVNASLGVLRAASETECPLKSRAFVICV